MDLSAIIVAKVGSKIAKVQCKTCKKEHVYRAAKGVKTPALKKQTARRGPAENGNSTVEAEWKKLMGEAAEAKRIKYNVKTKLELGEVVIHASFGEGVVVRLIHPNKAEIIFEHDVKLLVHAMQ